MKTIRLTFKKDKRFYNYIISMFFRLAGIYVADRYIYKDGNYINKNLKERIEYLSDKNNVELKNKKEYQYDAEIFILSTNDMSILEQETKKYIENKIFIIDNDDAANNHIISKIKDENQLIRALVNKLYNLQLISKEEYQDLSMVRYIYEKNNYFNIIMKSKYFFYSDKLYDKNCSKYNDAIQSAINKLSEQKFKDWGDNRYHHTQYAVVEMAYELNAYCHRNQKGMKYSVNNLINIAASLNEKYSFKEGLLGQIYYYLQEAPNQAYNCYVNYWSKDDFIDNAFILKEMGLYWEKYNCNYEKAIIYYLKSILLFPEYFSSWYRMGCCYYKLNNKKMALFCFNTVVEILENDNYDILSSKELEYLFLSLTQCSTLIYEIETNIEKSIEYSLKAEKLWNNIPNNLYLEKISYDSKEKLLLINNSKQSLNIKEISKHISNMYLLKNQYDIAEKYKNKYLE